MATQKKPVFRDDLYTYVASFGSLVAGGKSTQNINIETDADFIIDRIMFYADIAGAPQTADSRVIPLIDISLTDTGSGRNLQDKPVPLVCMAGDGALPFILPKPRKLRANSTLNVTAENISAATTYANFRIVFSGYKRFYG